MTPALDDGAVRPLSHVLSSLLRIPLHHPLDKPFPVYYQ